MVQGRGVKNSWKVRTSHPCPLLFAPMGTILLQYVNITIECVDVAVEAQAQKEYY